MTYPARPIRPSYEHKFKIVIYGPGDVSGPAIPRSLTCRLSKDIINEMSAMLEFNIEDAEEFFNQFGEFNPIQHGSQVEMYVNDISGGIMADPVPVDGWIKKFTGHILDPEPSAAAGSRAMNIKAVDLMWAVANARARIHRGTFSLPVNARLSPIDDARLVWQVVDENDVDIFDLDDKVQPIITKFVQIEDPPVYEDPLPAGQMLTLSPNDYGVNYSLGRVVFKDPQKPEDYPTDNYGFYVICHQFYQKSAYYQLEDALIDFLTSPKDRGGPGLTLGVEFDFYDEDGDALTDHAPIAITGISVPNDEFEVAGDVTTNFTTGKHFSVSASTGNNGRYSVEAPGATFGGGVTTIPVNEDVTDATVDGNIYIYAYTGIIISRIDWDEDSGTGEDYISMLRETGVMPYNYFLHADENNLIRGEYILQQATAERSISSELFANFPSSMDDTFTQSIVLSNGNTYPTPLISSDTATLTYLGYTYGHGNIVLPATPGKLGGERASRQDNDRYDSGTPGWIANWQEFPEEAGTNWVDNLTDGSILTYTGLAAGGTFKYFVDEPESYTEFFYPFPSAKPGAVNSQQDTVVMWKIVFDDPKEIDKILLQMYIPRCGLEDKEHVHALYHTGDSRGAWNNDLLLLNNQMSQITSVLQTALISVMYGEEGNVNPNRGLGPQFTAISMDPTKSDTKILKLDRSEKIQSLGILYHRPFVAECVGGRMALYMLNSFQAYDRGTIFLPGTDANDEKRLPFARITNTNIDASLIGETNTINGGGVDIANNSITTPNGTIEVYDGCFLCIPDAANEVFIAEVMYNDRGGVNQEIFLRNVRGKSHTSLNDTGVIAGDTWYLMHNRYWLDLLYDRIDLYREQYYTKLDSLSLPYKTKTIENDNITDLGTCLRAAVSDVKDSMANFSGIEVSLAYRPDYEVGQTVDDPVLRTPRYFLSALDYYFDAGSAVVNCKLTNFDQLTS